MCNIPYKYYVIFYVGVVFILDQMYSLTVPQFLVWFMVVLAHFIWLVDKCD